jgi:2-keto-3-deoxy-L-fuconate dehydrogenase
MSSITALRATPNAICQNVGAAYAAARGAQIAWVQAAGAESAKFNIQINAIAQGFIDNPTFYPEKEKNKKHFSEHLALIPANRLGTAEECTSLAVFLAGQESNFFVGQCFPVSGGWVT